ncbi:MAG: chemotaxis protein CheB [Methanomassiliicoccus sp.]|nr:chemotaxis protein CheB [Methanomassiliicoccus sp.]
MVNGERTKNVDNVLPNLSMEETFPIVALGSSAGGLEAQEAFFKNSPSDPEVAYVVITHLEPHHPSLMAEIISKSTSMEAFQAEDGMTIQKNKIYVIPPAKYMIVTDGTLRLLDRDGDAEPFLPIDYFFRSLAEDRKENAIAIVLSGNGSDGSVGIRAIHANLGMVMVQSPETAKYDSMPRSAIETGLVDFVLPPNEMSAMMLKYVHTLETRIQLPKAEQVGGTDFEHKILSIVKNETGHDFFLYKKSTINRRIERRIAVHQFETKEQYIKYLLANPEETHLLFSELIIEVTSFFRNPEAFASLKDSLRKIVLSHSGDVLRAWVTACSTGEEAYSIGIIMRELMEETGKNLRVQIFGSDINERAINTARTGDYPPAIADDIDATRLEKYFIKHENGYRVRKEVRDMVVFAPHDINRDPPFLHLDLLTCRNLLIYFQPALQRRALETFSHALNSSGILFLGESETINGYDDRFVAIDPKWKVYQRKSHTQTPPIWQSGVQPRQKRGDLLTKTKPTGEMSLNEKAEKILLSEHTPPSLIINDKNEIVYFHGQIKKYLEPRSGRASFNVQDMLREDIRYAVMSATDESRATGRSVLKEGVQVHSDHDTSFLNLIVRPLDVPASITNILVIFDERSVPHNILQMKKDMIITPDVETRIHELEKELGYTRATLSNTIEQLETSNEELTSTNEELQSNNEELQSVAEESETGKEELSSLNEELMTVNAELEKKNQELIMTSSDMRNILNSIDEAIIFLDMGLRIRRFTNLMQTIMNLLPGDVGRPIQDITTNLKDESLVVDVKKVLDSLNTQEKEVQTKDGHWYKIKILPYRTIENVIDGVVVTFSDINAQKMVQENLKEEKS